jgi:GntR family transcriptional regulator
MWPSAYITRGFLDDLPHGHQDRLGGPARIRLTCPGAKPYPTLIYMSRLDMSHNTVVHMPIPRGRPRYQQIADELRRRIQTGIIPAGMLLPGEPAMIREFGTARGTIRQALDVLRSEGLIVTEQGRGSYARPVRRMVHVSNGYLAATGATWRQQLEAQGMVGRQSIDAAGMVEAPPEVAALLGERVVVRERTMYADGQPVQLVVSYYAEALAAGTEIADQRPIPGGSLAALRRLDVIPARARELVMSRNPTGDERERLHMLAGIPVIVHLRTTMDETGQPVQHDVTVMAADRCVLDYDLPIPVERP